MKICCIFVSVFCLIAFDYVKCHPTFSVAMKYFKYRNIIAVNSFLCENGDRWNLTIQTKADHPLIASTTNSASKQYLANILRPQHYKIGMIFNLNCQNSWEILDIVSGHHMLNMSFLFAMISNVPKEKLIKSFEPYNFRFDSDITLFTGNTLYDVYRTARPQPLISKAFGRWNETGDIEIFDHNVKRPRMDLGNATLTVATVVKEFDRSLIWKDIYYDDNYRTSVDALSRFASKLHKYIEYLVNFNSRLVLTSDWGYYNPKTQKFNNDSMFGVLYENKSDFGISLSWMHSSRVHAAFYTPVPHIMISTVVFRHPPAGASINAFARPFTYDAWLVIFLYVFGASFFLYLIRRFNVEDEPPNEQQYSTSLIHVAGVICLQGTYIESLRIPTRIVSVFLHFLGLMVYSYYGAELVTFLLTPSPRTITTLDKLLESGIDLWLENVSFHRQHFMAQHSALASKFYEKAIKGPTLDQDKIVDRAVGLQMVQKGGVGLYGLTTNIFEMVPKTYTSTEICSLYFMDLLYMKLACGIQKQSPYREMYHTGTVRLLESGFVNFEEKRWNAQKPQCVGTEESVAVKLEATFIAQMIYLSGFVLTLIMFILERRFPPHKRDKKL